MNLDEARSALNAGANVVSVLYRIWHLLSGGNEYGMAASKLNRIENATWRDPVMTFTIERHGKLDGELQTWKLDLAQGTAVRKSERSLRPRTLNASFDAAALAAEIAALIRAGKDDPRLRWQNESRHAVKVITSRVLPQGDGPPTSGQAARLRDSLAEVFGDEWLLETGLWVRSDRA